MAAKEWRVEGSSAGIAGAARALDTFSEERLLPSALVRTAHVALDEVLSNVVKAGFEPGARGHFEMSLDTTAGVLELVVRYDGHPFNPLDRKDPDTHAALDDRPVGGLGIYFVKKLMDTVEYQRVGGANQLRMTKRIGQ